MAYLPLPSRKRKSRRAHTGEAWLIVESGTDGHRTIGRTWHASRLTYYPLAKLICLSTRNTLPLSHPKMICSLLPLTIQYWCLYLTTLTLQLILAGRFLPRNGESCSSGSSKENRCVASRVIMVCPMRQSGECDVLHVAVKWET